MITRIIRLLMGDSGGMELDRTVTIEADGAEERSITVPGPTAEPNDLQVDLAIAKDNLKFLYLVSDKDAVVKTNSKTEADDTFNLSAGVPLIWYVGCELANPFTADVAALFLTTASETDATVELRALVDTTP